MPRPDAAGSLGMAGRRAIFERNKILRSTSLLCLCAVGLTRSLSSAFTAGSTSSLLSPLIFKRNLRGGNTQRFSKSITMSEPESILKQQNWSWQQTMLRIKDPKKTIPFYQVCAGGDCKYELPLRRIVSCSNQKYKITSLLKMI